MTRQFHRPARLNSDMADSLVGSQDTAEASELAHRTAQTLLGGYPSDDDTGSVAATASKAHGESALSSESSSADPITRAAVVALVATQGVDAVAELWADSPASTLPGTLWRLFLVREWIRRDLELVSRRYATTVTIDDDNETGARLDAALLTATPAPSPQDIRDAIDAALTGSLAHPPADVTGTISGANNADADNPLSRLSVITARVAAFLRALAAGSHPVWIDDDTDDLADRVTRRDSALLATADELDAAARRAALGILD